MSHSPVAREETRPMRGARKGYHWIIETWDVYNLRLNLPAWNFIYYNKRIVPDCLGVSSLCENQSRIVRGVV